MIVAPRPGVRSLVLWWRPTVDVGFVGLLKNHASAADSDAARS